MIDTDFEGEAFDYNDFELKVTDADCIRIIDKYRLRDDLEKCIWRIWEKEEDDSILGRLVLASKIYKDFDQLLEYYEFIECNKNSVQKLYKILKKLAKIYNRVIKNVFQFDDVRKEVCFFYPYACEYLKVLIKAREEMRLEIEVLFSKIDYDEDVVFSPDFISTVNSYNNMLRDGGMFLVNLNGNLTYRYAYEVVDYSIDLEIILRHIDSCIRQCTEFYDSISPEDILKYKGILDS